MKIKYFILRDIEFMKTWSKTMQMLFPIMSNLQIHYHFKIAKQHHDNQMQSLELHCRIS